jgi:methyl-accepting chemotaxis protein
MKQSVNTKLLLAVFFSLTLTLSLTLIILFGIQGEREMLGVQSEVESAADMIAGALEFAMAEGISDFSEFQENAENTGKTVQLRIQPTDVIYDNVNKDLDDFERLALNSGNNQVRFEEFENLQVVRVATPILASESCVDCHGGNIGDVMSIVSLRSSIEDNKAAIAAFRWQGTLLGTLVITFTLLLIYLIVKRVIIKKLKTIVDMSQILATGDVSESLEVESNDEIGELADSMSAIHAMLRTKADEAEAISRGDLNVDIAVISEQDRLGHAMQRVRTNLIQMRDELSGTIEAQVAGDLDSRCNTTIVEGTYRELMEGINNVIETIVNPMNRAITLLAQYAEGNFSSKMEDLPGKQIKFTNAVNLINTNLDRLCSEGSNFIQATKNGDLGYESDTTRFHGSYLDIVQGFNQGLSNLKDPIRNTVQVLEALSNGDMTKSISKDYSGEYATLKDSLNTSLTSLNEMMIVVSNSVELVTTSSDQVSTSSMAMSSGATEQAASLEEINSAMVELDAQTKKNTADANSASDISDKAMVAATEGNGHMKNMLAAMEDITGKSVHVQKIIKIIDEIAFQTNLLALNAAVEAARAGVHGRGFAVVAEEVRSLAQRSATAAAETNTIIEDNLKSVSKGSDIAQNTASSLTEIITSISDVTELVNSIAHSSQDQTSVTHDITTSLSQIDQVTQSNAAVSEETAAAAEELHSQIVQLQGMLDEFTLRTEGQVEARIDNSVTRDLSFAVDQSPEIPLEDQIEVINHNGD